jgi:hypothetical protein
VRSASCEVATLITIEHSAACAEAFAAGLHSLLAAQSCFRAIQLYGNIRKMLFNVDFGLR